LLGLMLAALPLASSACTKTVRWFDDAPYSFKGADGRPTGFDVELARDILRRMGCHPNFVSMPWARALAELEAGRLDILPGSFQDAQRQRYAYFSNPSLQSSNVLYLGPGVAGRYRLSNLNDLLGTDFRLGVQIGVNYGPQFEALRNDPGFHGNQVRVTLRRNAWQMMSIGRLHGMIADEASAPLELAQLGLAGQIKASGVVVSTNTAMFAFSKSSVEPAFVAGFNKALAATFADGTYQQLRARFLPCPSGAKILGCK
jgi:polar amino acid transport system substrate-binding protein